MNWLRVTAQRLDLPVDRGADLDPRRGLTGPEQVEPADLVGLEPGPREIRECHRVPGRRVDGVDRGDARRPVVRVVDAGPLVEQDLGVVGEDRVRPELADLAHEQLAQRQLVGQRPIRLVQEPDIVVADDGGGPALLHLARGRQLQRVELGVLAALVPAGAADEPPHGAAVDPARGRRRRPEIRIVGVRHDDHEPGRPPRVRRDDGPFGRRLGRHRAAQATTNAARGRSIVGEG